MHVADDCIEKGIQVPNLIQVWPERYKLEERVLNQIARLPRTVGAEMPRPLERLMVPCEKNLLVSIDCFRLVPELKHQLLNCPTTSLPLTRGTRVPVVTRPTNIFGYKSKNFL